MMTAQAERPGYRNPKKGQCSPAFGLQRSFPLINELGEQYGITDCCRVFEVNRGSCYAWRQRQGKTNLEREALKVVLIKYHKASRGSAGARTLSEDLRGAGRQVGRYMARGLMKEAGIASRQRRPHKYKSSGIESLVAEHELEREFYVADINKVWCADITYIQLGMSLSRA